MPDEKNPAVALDPNKPWYSFQASADQSRKAKVMIYDAIGGWFGVQTSQFVKELNALDVDEIELHLNSPGGAAFDGIAIHNALRQHQAKVTVIVDGLAASAASIVAMGGDEVVMARGSQLMIHDATAIAWGNAATQRKTAAVLDKLSDGMAEVYAAKAGGEATEWRAAMLAETWYNADEAVTAGLADRTDSEAEADAEAVARFDLSAFAYAGRGSAPAPTLHAASAMANLSAEQRNQRRDDAAQRLAAAYVRLFGGEESPEDFANAEPANTQAATTRPNAETVAADAKLWAKAFPSGPPGDGLSDSERAEFNRLFHAESPDPSANLTPEERLLAAKVGA
jgi:ATP-dependent protease ClpP protease subunit